MTLTCQCECPSDHTDVCVHFAIWTQSIPSFVQPCPGTLYATGMAIVSRAGSTATPRAASQELQRKTGRGCQLQLRLNAWPCDATAPGTANVVPEYHLVTVATATAVAGNADQVVVVTVHAFFQSKQNRLWLGPPPLTHSITPARSASACVPCQSTKRQQG